MAADVRGERLVEADEPGDPRQSAVVCAQRAGVKYRPFPLRVVKYGEEVGAIRVLYPVALDNRVGQRVNVYLQGLVGLAPLVGDVIALELLLGQVGDVDEWHSLHIQAEKKQVAGESRLFIVRKGQLDEVLRHLAIQCPLACLFQSGEYLPEGAFVGRQDSLVERVIVDGPQGAVVEGDGIHRQSFLGQVTLEIAHQAGR